MAIKDRWQIGDVVRLVSLDGESNPSLKIGMTGRVFINDGRWSKNAVGVDWDGVDPDGYCHSFAGKLESNTGFYVFESQIELVDDNNFEVEETSLSDFLEGL